VQVGEEQQVGKDISALELDGEKVLNPLVAQTAKKLSEEQPADRKASEVHPTGENDTSVLELDGGLTELVVNVPALELDFGKT
jgi:hypothetical protein